MIGSYTGCDYVYNQNKTKQFTLDPLSSTTYLPWDLRTLPELTWRSYPGDLFTLIMFDAGFGVVHAFYVNIPGTNIGRANVRVVCFITFKLGMGVMLCILLGGLTKNR